jgi:predicted alpha/beta-hydrolase family hydrolase
MPEPRGEPLHIPFEPHPLEGLVYHAADGQGPRLILAHGAGAGQHSGFITAFARGIAARGVTVTTFDFPYMQHRRRAPDRAPVLEAVWTAMLRFGASQGKAMGDLFIGGKSMGGRIASQVLAAAPQAAGLVRGLVLLGYPLYPPGRPQQRRTAHLPQLRVPVLIVQGERDTFGTAAEVQEAFGESPASVRMVPVEGGDHSFKVPRSAGLQSEVDDRIRDMVAAWIKQP